MFDKERCSGIDVKVPSAESLRCWFCVTVIPKDYQNNETSESSGKPAARGVTLRAKGDLEQEHLPIHERSWSIVLCLRDLPGNVHPNSSKKTASLTRHRGKRKRDGALSWREYILTIERDNPNMIKGQTPLKWIFGPEEVRRTIKLQRFSINNYFRSRAD